MKIAYFDCFSGISGNMVLGALLDAGLDLARLEAELAGLDLDGYEFRVQRVHRQGLVGTHLDVVCAEQHVHRHLHDIEQIIDGSALPGPVKTNAVAIFRRLAEAEAHVHGEPVEQVHFHEVGALDAIVDVVGSVLALHLIGVAHVYASHLHIGRGTIQCAHGLLPVPAPATQELLKGVPVYGRDVDAELVTPTGAAIITTLAAGYGDAPPMTIEAIGYGAGTRELPHANLLRVAIGETSALPTGYEEDVVQVIETNLDDMNPQWYEHVTALLFGAGALDVWLTPIQMKQGRPGTLLSILAPGVRVNEIADVLFCETTTIGLRMHSAHRLKLARERLEVETPYGRIGVKISRQGGKVRNIRPEYRECQQVAQAHRVPIKEVTRVATELAHRAIAGESH